MEQVVSVALVPEMVGGRPPRRTGDKSSLFPKYLILNANLRAGVIKYPGPLLVSVPGLVERRVKIGWGYRGLLLHTISKTSKPTRILDGNVIGILVRWVITQLPQYQCHMIAKMAIHSPGGKAERLRIQYRKIFTSLTPSLSPRVMAGLESWVWPKGYPSYNQQGERWVMQDSAFASELFSNV